MIAKTHTIVGLFAHYRDLLAPDIVADCEAEVGANGLSYLLVTMPKRGLPLYVIIDEYDNFTNQMLKTESVEPYQSITHGDGFYREWFKKFTAGTPTTYLYIHYKGFDQIACEEVDPAAAVL